MFGKLFRKSAEGEVPSPAQALENLSIDERRMMVAANLVAAFANGYRNNSSIPEVIKTLEGFESRSPQHGYEVFVDAKAAVQVEAIADRAMIVFPHGKPPDGTTQLLELASTSVSSILAEQIGTNTPAGPVEGSLLRYFDCGDGAKRVTKLVVGPIQTNFRSREGAPLNGLIVDVTFGLSLPGYTTNT